MAVKIKKQYRQPDGTLIEVEGTEAEIEAFEKKQEKKRQSEIAKREKSILYGKDLENIRRIIQEELAKQPRYVYNYHYDRVQPYWYYQPTVSIPSVWSTSQQSISGNSIRYGDYNADNTSQSNWTLGTLTTTDCDNPTWATYTAATGSGQISATPTVSVFASNATSLPEYTSWSTSMLSARSE